MFPLEIYDSCASTDDGTRSRLIVPFLNNRHHFLTFLPFILFTVHFSNVPVNFRRMNNFVIWKSYHQLHFSGIESSIFVYIFDDYSEWRKNWHRSRQYTCYPSHTEGKWPLQQVRASPKHTSYSPSALGFWTCLWLCLEAIYIPHTNNNKSTYFKEIFKL